MITTLPLVVRENTPGFSKFKAYWHGQMVDAAIFKGHFYRVVAEFEERHRILGYQEALQFANNHQTLITLRDDDQSPIYTVWIDQWYESGDADEDGDKQDNADSPRP